MIPSFKQTAPGTYEVSIEIIVSPYGSVQEKYTPVVGTVHKQDARNWTFRVGQAATRTLRQTLDGEAFVYDTRKQAVEALMRAYQKNPKTVGAYDETHPDVRMINLCRQIARGQGAGIDAKTRPIKTYRRERFQQLHTKDALPGTNLDEFYYEDDVIQIIAGAEHGGLEITRKPMPDKGMPGSNPCTMVDNWGVCFRTHGESHYIFEHILTLAKELNLAG